MIDPGATAPATPEVQANDPSLGYLLVLYRVNPDGSTGHLVQDDLAVDIGNRLGLGSPSDPAGLGIWYVEK